MIKPITIPKTGRKFFATTMLATALVTGNVAELNAKNNQNNKTKTELVSKKAAKALEANAVNIGTFSIKQNKKLDKIYFKHCNPQTNTKVKKDSLDKTYNTLGTYGATIKIQREIDDYYIEQCFDSYLQHFSFLEKDHKRALKTKENFQEWQKNNFYKEIDQAEENLYKENKQPNAEKAIQTIDSHINNTNFFTSEDKIIYNKGCKSFQDKQKEKNSPMAKSDLLAYKVHLLNALAIKNFILSDKNVPDSHIFMYYLNYNFLNCEAQIKP